MLLLRKLSANYTKCVTFCYFLLLFLVILPFFRFFCPLDFEDISDSNIPAKYQTIGVTNASDYNRVNGKIMKGRITARIVEAIKAQVVLAAGCKSGIQCRYQWGKLQPIMQL